MHGFDALANGARIAVFGLSGNPPSGLGGHAGIVRHLVETKKFDEIWILAVYRHSYASKSNLELYEHRVNMCRLNFESESTHYCVVKVLTLEKEVYEFMHSEEVKKCKNKDITPSISMGSIDVIKYIYDYLVSRNVLIPRISLVLGTDTYNDLINGKWKNSAELMSLVNIEVIARKGVEVVRTSSFTDPCTVTVHTPETDYVSSTMIRAAIPSLRICRVYIFGKNSDELFLEKALNPSVHRYMRYKNLYCYSVESVRKRNLSRLYFFLQGIYIVSLLYQNK